MIGKPYNLSTVVMHMICGFFYLYPGTTLPTTHVESIQNNSKILSSKSMNFFVNYITKTYTFRNKFYVIILQIVYLHPPLMPSQPMLIIVVKSIMLTK